MEVLTASHLMFSWFEAHNLTFRVQDSEISGFRVQGLDFRVVSVRGTRCEVQGAGFKVRGSGCGVQGAEFKVRPTLSTL